MPWTKKYLPNTVHDIQAQNKQVATLLDFVQNFKKYKKKAILIYGSTGCGKTSSVYAVAKELGFEVIEVNASDYRRPDDLERTVGMASQQMSLFSKGKIILVDEVDGISGGKDRGGVVALAKLVGTSGWPMIMTANDPFDKKFTPLRKVCEMIQFDTLRYTSVFAVLKNIATQEGVTVTDDDLKALARRAGGDLRGAITDLEVLSTTGTVITSDVDELSGRLHRDSMMTALMKILRSTDPIVALSAFDTVDEDFDKRMLWLDANMPVEYSKAADRYRAYECLSKADRFLRRIRRWQHWRYLVYVNQLITAGIAVAKDEKYDGFRPFKPSTRILQLWQANMKHKKKKDICSKVAIGSHTSSQRVMKDVLPFLKQMAHNDLVLGDAFLEEFNLNKEELEWLGR